MKLLFIFVGAIFLALPINGEIDRIWLTHQRNEPTHLVIHWETARPSRSLVRFGTSTNLEHRVEKNEATVLHRIEVPFDQASSHIYYAVESGEERSEIYAVKTYSGPKLRVGVVADWQGKPPLPGLMEDDVHLLLTAGDNIANLHSDCGLGVKECWKPYSKLIARYAELFRTVPVMPALGNHDREIRPRGNQPPSEPVYDIEATAFCTFFSLPNDGWKWQFDIPQFDLRFVALDLNHTSDQGNTWQTCHGFQRGLPQFEWYRQLMEGHDRRFVITLQNEQNYRMRRAEQGAWGRMFERGSAVITGFGYFAERAEVNGFPYYNTALGVGDKYPDPNSKFFQSTASYLLLEFKQGEGTGSIRIKDLEGNLLDERELKAIGKR